MSGTKSADVPKQVSHLPEDTGQDLGTCVIVTTGGSPSTEWVGVRDATQPPQGPGCPKCQHCSGDCAPKCKREATLPSTPRGLRLQETAPSPLRTSLNQAIRAPPTSWALSDNRHLTSPHSSRPRPLASPCQHPGDCWDCWAAGTGGVTRFPRFKLQQPWTRAASLHLLSK